MDSSLRRLMSRLACPVTKGDVWAEPSVNAGDDIKEGRLVSAAGVVGTIRDFKPRFTGGAPVDIPEQPTSLKAERIWKLHEATEVAPQAKAVDSHWRMLVEPVEVSLKGRLKIKFGAHPSSGIVKVGDREIDLFHANSLVPLTVDAEGPTTITPCGRRNPKSRNSQVLLESIEVETEEMRPAIFRRTARNRARPFRARPLELLADVPSDGVMIDIGGGRRMMDDPRYINMEYDLFDEADLYADAQSLPFKTGSVDFIHSTAVFEHLPHPRRAAEEIFRVLKPGGRAYVVTAFMQPVHSEPQHFYNASIYGLDQWFDMFPDRSISWGGRVSGTLLTLAKAGARGVPADKMKRLQEALEALDEYVTQESLMYVASETVVEAIKPID
ncbi:class I SAM-dependent methyltransferase [Brevundimonas sp.]|jgi:SAM-dependent methyltransferase|uniref:class I SAM-dependent methyltransferase n=1 Tax=Brevundimonas sp. TaxID=1871086 RepID=UPI0037BEDF25